MFDFEALPEQPAAAAKREPSPAGAEAAEEGVERTCPWCGGARNGAAAAAACDCELNVLRERGMFDFEELDEAPPPPAPPPAPAPAPAPPPAAGGSGGGAPAAGQEARRLERAWLGPELEEPELCTDANGTPRGRCEGCDGCEALRVRRRSYVRWLGCSGSSDEEEAPPLKAGDRVEVRDHVADDWLPGAVVSVEPLKVALDKWLRQSSGAAEELRRSGASWEMVRRQRNPDRAEAPCERCGCAASRHAKLDKWLGEALRSLRRFRATGKNTKRELPRRSRVPVEALEWQHDEVALFVLTEGIFDPRRDGRSVEALRGGLGAATGTPGAVGSRSRPLVSVVTPTSERRQHFHPLLYESFRTQSYEPKELVVVDTGSSPSPFLLDCAGRDRRVIYRWFDVQDARMQDLADCFMDTGDDRKKPPWMRRHGPRPKGKVHGGVRVEGWTLGLKRNLACHLARGAVLAHFDDDDLYAPCYLEVMTTRLREAAARSRAGAGGASLSADELPAAAATLQDWHVLDLADQTFGFISPKTEVLLPQDMRESFTYGFGFSYVYTRAAWEVAMFADVEWSEDGHFTDELMAQGKAVRLVQTSSAKSMTDALAAHSHHRDTTSAGEFVDYMIPDKSGYRQTTASVRLGCKVNTPKAFAGFLPLLGEVAARLELRKGDVHPVRKQLSDRPFSTEIGLTEKQAFMQTDVGQTIEEVARNGHAPRPGAASSPGVGSMAGGAQPGGWRRY